MVSSKNLIIIPVFLLTSFVLNAQKLIDQKFEVSEYQEKLDSLRTYNEHMVSETGSMTEIASQLALLHYPTLKGNKIKIKYKTNVRYPITASWSFWNIFKLKKNHTYVLLIKPGTFVDNVSLNKQVGIIGHEMAHFEYYRKRPSVNMIPWGTKYIFSKKFRYEFERNADRTAIERGLGYQLLDLSFYISREEVLQYMNANNHIYKLSQ